MTARAYGATSLGLLAVYAAAVFATSHPTSTAFAVVQPFPIGATTTDGWGVLQFTALLLGLSFGWGVPGVSLALLIQPRLSGLALLGRAIGLGVGFVFGTGLVHAIFAGHAPGREATLVLNALPCAALVARTSRDGAGRASLTPLVALVTMVLLAGILWPKLRLEAMGGDGTEAYELARSLESHVLPRWDMEGAVPSRFGIPVTVPFFTGAYLTHAEMQVVGESELAIRLPFVSSLVMLVATAFGLANTSKTKHWGASAYGYTAAITALYVVWNAYFVGYEAPIDLAEPAGTDTLTIALWLAGFAEVMGGSLPLGIGFMVLAAGTTHSAAVLSVLALVGLWWLDRDRGLSAIRLASVAASIGLVVVAAIGSYSGDWSEWLRQFEGEYW